DVAAFLIERVGTPDGEREAGEDRKRVDDVAAAAQAEQPRHPPNRWPRRSGAFSALFPFGGHRTTSFPSRTLKNTGLAGASNWETDGGRGGSSRSAKRRKADARGASAFLRECVPGGAFRLKSSLAVARMFIPPSVL